jgi:hypothetical protein
VAGAAADGAPLLEQARRTATTAAGLVTSDPYSAYVLAYDAARFACIALLAQQGLRATTSGGHYAVEQAVRAQFGDGFRPFGILRRRRNELKYPHLPADTASAEEAEQAGQLPPAWGPGRVVRLRPAATRPGQRRLGLAAFRPVGLSLSAAAPQQDHAREHRAGRRAAG